MTFASFEIKYETAADVPPPFCHYYHIRGKETPAGLETDFAWVYHNRDEMTQEEIEDEGFTGNDDFHWHGTIDRAWLPPLEALLAATRPTADASPDDPFLELDFRQASGPGFQGQPDILSEWEFFLQEFIQSIYETSGREAPLRIQYRKTTPETTFSCAITLHFADRRVSVQTRRGQHTPPTATEDWDGMKTALQQIYSLDYLPEKAETHKHEPEPGLQPGPKAAYLETGDGLWYRLGSAARNPSPKTDTAGWVEKFFDGLVLMG